jgi:hypothetical protein
MSDKTSGLPVLVGSVALNDLLSMTDVSDPNDGVTGGPAGTSKQVLASQLAALIRPPQGPQMFPLAAGGEVLFHPSLANQNAIALATGTMFLSYGYAQVSETIDHISIPTGGTAATGATYAAYVLFTVDGSGNLTRVAATASNTALWTTNFQAYNGTNVNQALTAPYAKVAGLLYAGGLLYVGAGTPPTIVGASGFAGDGGSSLAAGLSGKVTGLAAVPSSVAAGSVVSTPFVPALVLLP